MVFSVITFSFAFRVVAYSWFAPRLCTFWFPFKIFILLFLFLNKETILYTQAPYNLEYDINTPLFMTKDQIFYSLAIITVFKKSPFENLKFFLYKSLNC